MDEKAPEDHQAEPDHLEPWMEDGNIVLEAQGKYFRVHRSILSSFSDVFKGMFGCPELGGEKEELIEQCPVIHLHDAPTDLQIVLKAMYDRSYPRPYYEKVPLSIVSAFLRLGEKYAIQGLFDEGRARLRCAIEPTLPVDVAGRTSTSRNEMPQLFPGVTDSDPRNFQIMNLLQEVDLQELLPLTMYQCAITCPVNVIVNGYELEGVTYSLTTQNLRCFILVKNILETFRIRLAQSLRVSHGCIIQSSCARWLHRLWSDNATVIQPFGPWRPEWDNQFCSTCRADLNALRQTAIQKAWNQIPVVFGFDSWADVVKSGDFPCESQSS